jgi:hypothetical protein
MRDNDDSKEDRTMSLRTYRVRTSIGVGNTFAIEEGTP